MFSASFRYAAMHLHRYHLSRCLSLILLVLGGMTACRPCAAHSSSESFGTSQAQALDDEPRSVSLSRLSKPVDVDGWCDDEAWTSVEAFPMTMHQPSFKGELTEPTDVRMAYSEEALFVCGYLYDHPGRVRAHSLTRDVWNGGDYFGVFIDRYNDNETALYFWTTPAGIQGDWAYADDGDRINRSWNAVWSVATQQTGNGWTFEMRIPLSSVGMQATSSEATIGLILFRNISRKNELQTYPALSPDRNPWMPSRAQNVTLTNVRPNQPLYVTPYVLSGREKTADRQGQESAVRRQTTTKADVGGDVRYRFSNGFTLDATVNTDFAQVEADDARVNLSRFSLFFPEKRQFFQVRSGLFEFPTYQTGADRLFYSRRIGLEGGRQIPILGGAKLTGRSNTWDVGGMAIQTARDGAQPSETFGVARIRRQVLDERSYTGGLLTTRMGLGGVWYATYGLDGKLHVGGNEVLTLRWAQSVDSAPSRTSAHPLLRSSFAFAQWERRQRIGLAYRASFARGGSQFEPPVGFTTRRDVTELSGALQYSSLLKETPSLQVVRPGAIQGYAVLRNRDGSVESARVEYAADLEWQNQAEVGVSAALRVEDLLEPLHLPDSTIVPASRYTFGQIRLDVGSPSGRDVEVDVDVGGSSYYGGGRGEVSAEVSWNPSRFFGMSGAYAFDVVRFPERGQGFDSHVTRLRVRAAANSHLSANALVQYSTVADRVAANVRLRYHLRTGTDLWIVYNEQLNTIRDGSAPVLPRTARRVLLVKVTYMIGV